jgi:hypothetical protein
VTADIDGNVTIVGGDGNNTFSAPSGVTIAKNLSVTNGIGDASNTLTLSTVDGNVTIKNLDNTAAGVDNLQLSQSAIGGALRVDSGNGDTSSNIVYMQVAGALTFTSGTGKDTLYAGILTAGGDTKINFGGGGSDTTLQAATFMGGLTLSADAGVDNLTATNTDVGKAATISTGAGADEVSVDASRFNGAFTVQTGTDADTVWIAALGSGLNSFFYGAVAIQAGDGNDTLNIGIAGSGVAACFAKVVIDGGPGADSLIYPGNIFLVAPVISNF